MKAAWNVQSTAEYYYTCNYYLVRVTKERIGEGILVGNYYLRSAELFGDRPPRTAPLLTCPFLFRHFYSWPFGRQCNAVGPRLLSVSSQTGPRPSAHLSNTVHELIANQRPLSCHLPICHRTYISYSLWVHDDPNTVSISHGWKSCLRRCHKQLLSV